MSMFLDENDHPVVQRALGVFRAMRQRIHHRLMPGQVEDLFCARLGVMSVRGAYAGMTRQGPLACVLVSKDLVQAMDDKALSAIMAHELGHMLLPNLGRWAMPLTMLVLGMLAGWLVSTSAWLVASIIAVTAIVAVCAFLPWHKRRVEYACDAFAARATSPATVARSLRLFIDMHGPFTPQARHFVNTQRRWYETHPTHAERIQRLFATRHQLRQSRFS